MRTELLSSVATNTTVGSTDVIGGGALSLAQQALTELGWKDLRPAMLEAEQVDHERTMALQAVYAAYLEDPEEEFQLSRLEAALDEIIEQLRADYQHVTSLKEAAQQRLMKTTASSQTSSSSYLSQLGSWVMGGLQQFFSSDDVSIVERYGKIADSRNQAIMDLTRYRQSLATIEAEPSKSEVTPLTEVEEMKFNLESEDVIDLSTERSSGHRSRSRQLLWLPLSDEFRVNTETVGSQEYPSITRLTTGDFVITWQSEGQDGNLTGIYAQRYSSTGVPQGLEFRVNTYTTNFQNYSSVSGLSTGDFVVTWGSIAQDDKSSSGVFAQRHTGTGLMQGLEFQVNTYTTSHQRYSKVAGLTSGDFVIVWTSSLEDGSNNGVFAQRYSALGAKQGTEFRVNTYTLNQQEVPSVVGLSTGDFVVSWHSNGQDGDAYGIYAQRFSSAGVAQDAEFRVNTYTLGYQTYPSMASLVNGDFIVVWQDSDQEDRSTYGIYGQRYSSNGTAQSSEFHVNTYLTNDQQFPSVDGLEDGSFVVVWQSAGQDGSGFGIYAQRFSADGIALGSEFRVNVNTLGNQQRPSVVGLSGRDFVVTWQDDNQDGSGFGVYARVIRGNQMPVLTQPSMMLKDGETLLLTSQMFNATDADLDDDPLGLNFVISDIQHGYFTLLGNLGVPVTQWTLSQVVSGHVYFIHDSSNQAPGFNVSVSDGELISSIQAVDIFFNFRPILDNNKLIIKQGETLSINNSLISAMDGGSFDGSLGFTVTNVQHGQFELITNPTIAITQWTQAQIQAGQVRFVHDDTITAPGYQIRVSDGVFNSSLAVGTVIFNQKPMLINNTVSLRDGETIIMTGAMLSAADDKTPADDLIFMISNVQRGQFEWINTTGVAMTQWTQAQLQTGGVRFVHDNSNIAPSYLIHVNDGSLDSTTVAGSITFDRRPVIINNTLSLKSGESLLLTSTMLSATDDKTTAGALLFSVSNVQNGRFELIGNPGVALTQFTQSQIQAGQVRFVHDNSNIAPSYQLSVSDGVLTSTPVMGNITFDQRPVLTQNALSLGDGETRVITSAMLNVTDDKTPAGSLLFSISAVLNGQFELLSSPDIAVTQFTQAQINTGQVRFVHAGNNQPPSFNVSVSDGILSTTTQPATIIFNYRPAVMNNTLTIKDGETVVITSAMLSAADDKTTAGALTFFVNNVQRGQFELTSSPGVVITQWTQAQIQSGQVRFVHDGSNIAPSYQISVSDGEISSAISAPVVTFNKRPVVTRNQLTINQDESVLITPTLLNVDDDQSGAVVILNIFNVQGGHFALLNASSTPITQFSMAQIQAGQIVFVHTGGSVAPTYSVIANDGALYTPLSSAVVTFNPRPVLTANSLSLSGSGLVINMTTTQLQALDNQPDSQLTFTVSGVENGHFELTTQAGVSITQFTQADIKAGRVQFIRTNLVDMPHYMVSVSDGVLSTTPAAATITVNQRPILTVNTLTLNDGEAVIMTPAMLSATDDQSVSALTYTASGVQQGHFERLDNPGVAITQFTAQQVVDGQIKFVHAGNGQAPSYAISVSDGILSTSASGATVQFNARPLLDTNRLQVKEGDLVINITSAMLHVTDDNPAAERLFSISNLQGGYFVKKSVPTTPITQFTQADIDADAIAFMRTNTTQLPGYSVSVSDGELSTAPAVTSVSVNRIPVLSSNQLTLSQGDRVTITASQLGVNDDALPTMLIFNVSEVQRGQFELISTAGTAITQFTAQQVSDGQVRFVHDGSVSTPSYKISVTDGVFITSAQSAMINFNRLPVLKNNRLTVSQGKTVIITSLMLSAEDDGALPGQIRFTVSDVGGGQFTLVNAPGVRINTFTQQQIQDGLVQFIQDGSDQAPYYQVSVSDGQTGTPASPAVVKYSSSAQDSVKTQEDPLQNALKVGISSAASSAGGLLVAIVIYFYYKKHHENATRRHYPMAYDLFKCLNLNLSYISPTIDPKQRNDYLDAVTALTQLLDQKSGIVLETLRDTNRVSYQHYVELLSECIIRDIKTWRSEVCGIGLRGCLGSRELRLSQLKNSEKQAQIVEDVIAAVRSGRRPAKAPGCGASLLNFFCCRQQKTQLAIPSIREESPRSDQQKEGQAVECELVTLSPVTLSPVQEAKEDDEKMPHQIEGALQLEDEDSEEEPGVPEASLSENVKKPLKGPQLFNLSVPSSNGERTPTPSSRVELT
jgi:hypothetical protein